MRNEIVAMVFTSTHEDGVVAVYGVDAAGDVVAVDAAVTASLNASSLRACRVTALRGGRMCSKK